MPKERLVWEGHRQRLRQRMEREGWDALRPHERVELVLNHAVPRQNLSDVARALVARFGSVGGVFAADREALMSVEGMTRTLAEWVVLTGELLRAYHDLQAEGDLRLGCYQEVLAFLRPRVPEAVGEPTLWALYADFDFNLITYTDFGPTPDCFDAPVARRLLMEAVSAGARYAYLVRLSGEMPAVPDAAALARLEALATTLRAADVALVDFVLFGQGGFLSLRAEGGLREEEAAGRSAFLREAYLGE